MTDLIAFVTTFWPKWIAVVSAFALFGIEPLARSYWPWLAHQLDRLAPQTRRRFEFFVLVAAVFYAGFASWSEEHQSASKAQNEADELRRERDEVKRQRDANVSPLIDRLSGDLTAARAKIDAQQTEIEKLRPKPPRHLSDDDKNRLVAVFGPLKTQFPELKIGAPGDGEAQGYAREFADQFDKIGIKVPHVNFLISGNANSAPLQIAIRAYDKVPQNAELFAKALTDAGFPVVGAKMETLAENEFMLVVSSQR